MLYADNEGPDQTALSRSLIRVFGVRLLKRWIYCRLIDEQKVPWCDCADGQADLSLCCSRMT